MSQLNQDQSQIDFAFLGHVELLSHSIPVFCKNKIKLELGEKFSQNLGIFYPDALFLTRAEESPPKELEAETPTVAVQNIFSDFREGKLGDGFLLKLNSGKSFSDYLIPRLVSGSGYAAHVKDAFSDFRMTFQHRPDAVTLLCSMEGVCIEEQVDSFFLEKLLVTSHGAQVDRLFSDILKNIRVDHD